MKFENFLSKNILKGVENLDESAFKIENIDHVCDLYGKLMGKKFGSPFRLVGKEKYVKTSGKGLGVRMMNDNGQMLRFNFSSQKTGFSQHFVKNSMVVSSIDYWAEGNKDFEKPTLTVTFNAGINVLDIWAGLSKVLLTKKKGTYRLDDFVKDDVNESYDESKELNESPADVRVQFLLDKGYPKSYGYSKEFFLNKIKELGIEKDWEEYSSIQVDAGKKETNEFGEKIRTAQKKFEDTVYANPDYVFQDIEELTKFVGKGGNKSLIICGMGGVGKTYHVKKVLKEELGKCGLKWEYHSGMKVSPTAFYMTVFSEKDKCIVFDEADSILQNDDIIMMLKPALDTDGDHRMEYNNGKTRLPVAGETWEDVWKDTEERLGYGAHLAFGNKSDDETAVVPGRFLFDGQMIFISNMRASQIEDAIKSRSLYVDVYLSATDKVKRIKTIAKASHPNLSDEQIDMLMESLGSSLGGTEEQVTYMTPELARKSKPITVRSMEIGIALMEAGFERWQHLASMYA